MTMEEGNKIIVRHPEGAVAVCEMPDCPNKTTFPLMFCGECQLFVDRIDFASSFLGYYKP